MISQGSNRSDAASQNWAGAAAVGVVIYVLVDLALAVLRPGLSLIHNPESDYGVGPYSWLMDLNFLLRGALTVCLAVAIVKCWRPSWRVRLGLLLLVGWGVFSALLAFFPDDPLGTPATESGAIHLLLALVAFFCALVGTIVLSVGMDFVPQLQQVRSWLLSLSLLAVVPFLALGRVGFRTDSAGGLFERVFLALELAWILVAALTLALKSRRGLQREVDSTS